MKVQLTQITPPPRSYQPAKLSMGGLFGRYAHAAEERVPKEVLLLVPDIKNVIAVPACQQGEFAGWHIVCRLQVDHIDPS